MPEQPWSAPVATAPLAARVEVPGSKSLTNRLLVLAALADGPGVIRGALRSRDTDLMIAGLRALGAEITEGDSTSTLIVRPLATRSTTSAGSTTRIEKQIDVGLAGTVMRFLPAVAALTPYVVRFSGDDAARRRPMAPLLAALRELGVQVTGNGLPFVVHGTGGVPGGFVQLDASASSQFVSGLMLAAPRFANGLRLQAVGEVPSAPHLAMTVAELRAAGVYVATVPAVPGQIAGQARYSGSLPICETNRWGENDGEWDGTGGGDIVGQEWVVAPGPIAAREVRIEPDLSNAAPFLAAALVAGGRVTIPGWPAETTQPGKLLPGLLQQMGATVTWADDELTVCGTGQIRGIQADLSAAGELTPTIAALAALADSPSRLTGIGHLRGHETDRLAALVTEITRLGGDAQELPDGIEINPAPLPGGLHDTLLRELPDGKHGGLHGGQWESYADHRMATAGAIIGLRIPNVTVSDIATTAKTLPGFATMWAQLLTGGGQAR